MRERAGLMAGKLTVWTAAESDTEIEPSIAAVHASAASAAPRRSRLADRFTGKREHSES